MEMELDEDAFYICTEISPRCYVVSKATTIDKGHLNRMVGNLSNQRHQSNQQNTEYTPPPPAPQIPHWFDNKCLSELLSEHVPANSVPAAPSPIPTLPMPDLKHQLKTQLEYYFSRENLITDRYLRCQMDTDQFVPISIIAGFRKIVQLTNDYNLILQVLRESNQVEVDDRGEKVRPVCRRCTIILREISEQHREDVERMLAGGPAYMDLKYGLNNSWYVIYDNEETTQKAYLHLQNLDTTFNNRPICARIKAGGPPTAELPPIERVPAQTPELALDSYSPLTELSQLGQLLGSYGYVARATYRAPNHIVQVNEMDDPRPMSNGQGSRSSQPRGRNSFNSGISNGGGGYYGSPPATSPVYGGQYQNDRPPRRDGGGGRGRGTSNGTRRGERSYHHGGRRNGGANGSAQHEQRRRADYWNASGTTPSLSVSTGDLTSDVNTQQQIVERPRYNSFRKASHQEEPSTDLLSATSSRRRWEEADSDAGSESHGDRKSSHSGGSVYSFEERSFPSLSEPKPQPEKPAEKPSFSCVAAGKRYAKPEPKKSYAEKLKEKKNKV